MSRCGRSNELDVNRIIKVFDRHGVDYLIVGDVAANLHGATRPTGDLDANHALVVGEAEQRLNVRRQQVWLEAEQEQRWFVG